MTSEAPGTAYRLPSLRNFRTLNTLSLGQLASSSRSMRSASIAAKSVSAQNRAETVKLSQRTCNIEFARKYCLDGIDKSKKDLMKKQQHYQQLRSNAYTRKARCSYSLPAGCDIASSTYAKKLSLPQVHPRTVPGYRTESHTSNMSIQSLTDRMIELVKNSKPTALPKVDPNLPQHQLCGTGPSKEGRPVVGRGLSQVVLPGSSIHVCIPSDYIVRLKLQNSNDNLWSELDKHPQELPSIDKVNEKLRRLSHTSPGDMILSAESRSKSFHKDHKSIPDVRISPKKEHNQTPRDLKSNKYLHKKRFVV